MSSDTSGGFVILDTNALAAFEDQERLAAVRGSMRAAHLWIWPSSINALEIVRHENAHIRSRLATVLETLQVDRPLLPPPDDLLHQTALARLGGADGMLVDDSGFEWLTSRPENMSAEQRAEVVQTLDQWDTALDNAFTNNRQRIQQFLKQPKLGKTWDGAEHFLEEVWLRPSQLDDLVASEWLRLGLPNGPPSVEKVLEIGAWRLHFAGFGAALYHRVIAPEQSRKIQAVDIAQLVYLGGRSRALIVTRDMAFLKVAIAATATYPSAVGAMSLTDFLNSSGAKAMG